jgi:predicted MFS family arabinose efflux permease
MQATSSFAARAWLPLALAGWCATLAGLGIGRFAYVPLLPLMIDAGWARPSGAAQLAAANLLGYLAGALAAHPLALRFGATRTIRFALVVLPLSFVAIGLQPSLAWMWFWRLAAGVAGGLLMIIAAPHVMARVPVAYRGKAVGIVFAGIGVGIIIGGLGVPAAGGMHLRFAWMALAACCFAALLLAWPQFADDGIAPPASEPGPLLPRGPMLALACAYALDAIGYLPHAVFWVEYLVHGLQLPMSIGGVSWAIFGLGAAVGPLITGYAADRFGFRITVVASLALKSFAVALPLLSSALPALLLSAFLVGALTPGLVAVTSGRVVEIAGAAAHRRNWAMLTFMWALLQAAGGYAMAALYGALHSFSLLFSIGAVALAAGAVIAAGTQRTLAKA